MDGSNSVIRRDSVPSQAAWASWTVFLVGAFLWLIGSSMLFANNATEDWWADSRTDFVEKGYGRYPKSGVLASAEWLNWRAHRGGMDFASFVDPIWLTPATIESADYGRDNGMRAGLGYRFDSGWDVSWNYTHFQTKAAGAVDQSANPGLVLIATRSYFDLAMDSVTAQAELDYGVHDLEAGRRLVWDNDAELRLFGGFRWAKIDQTQNQGYTYQDNFGDWIDGTIDGRNRLEAYGIRLGAETQWTTRGGLGLFGRLAGSVLLGDFDVRQRETDQVQGTILDFADTHTRAVPVIDATAGVSWTYHQWQLAGGYEMTTWFNMGEIERASYDLILDGFFLRLSYAR